MQSPKDDGPVVSTTRTLTRLLGIPANRSCADCRVTLVDSSQVHASFSPPCSNHPRRRYNDFRLNHLQFAPPNTTASRIPETYDPPVDPAVLASERLGHGHGVFVCALCGAAHKLLGKHITIVHAVQDSTAWDVEKVEMLRMAGGNARSWAVLERYVPALWQARRPKAISSIADRLTFVRAKYEALAFCLPPSGPLATRAWRAIVDMHREEWDGLWGTNLKALSELELGLSSESFRHLPVEPSSEELPNRLVDFFCVVTASDFLDPALQTKDLSKLSSPDDLLLAPRVSNCFPVQDAHSDMEFPEHVGTFICPEGCRPSSTPIPPSFFTFVLTCADGNRLYGGVLRLYDIIQDTETLSQVLDNSGYEGQRPVWLKDDSEHKDSVHSGGSEIVYLPKCLVILSHYGFFDLWRKFLLKIYRIALVEAPLPIERFIANFCAEVPLPPPGKVQVKFGFTVKDIWSIQRPPENQLPLADFSFKPLFASLSVANILVVFGCLLQETRVALVSKHYALLGPVAEALMSMIFPFHWQGMYVPVMPYNMLDILEAPVPYLVGLHSRYLTEISVQRRPQGVVFVDLDRDVVHLGYEDDSKTPRLTPALPERDALKLKSKLDRYGANIYIMPDTGKAGCVLTADDKQLPYSERDLYAHINASEVPSTVKRRKEVFGSIDKAYNENELLVPITGFLSEHGQLYEREVALAGTPKSKSGTPIGKFLQRTRHTSGSSDSIDDMSRDLNQQEIGLLDMDEPPEFSSTEIRNAFLRFFVSVFRDYRQYMDTKKFRSEDFLANLNVSSRSVQYMESLVRTQMFDRFLQERREDLEDPEVRFFDESINAKLKRSKKTAIANFGKGIAVPSTTFLEDTSYAVTDTYSPPPPSNWGLPDDGRCYHYGSFPELDQELFGKIRPPMEWQQERRSSVRMPRRASAVAQEREQAMVAKARIPVVSTSVARFSSTKKGVKSLDAALNALSSPFTVPVVSLGRKKPNKPKSKSHRKRSSQTDDIPDAERNSSIVSDITLSSTLQLEDIVSTAEEVVVDARRKQSILLGIIIKLQAFCRMYLAKARYNRLKGEQESPKPRLQKSESYLLRKKVATAVKIQSWFRAEEDRRKFSLMRKAAIQFQALTRGRRARFAFDLLLGSIARIQARFRGCLTRQHMSFVLEERMKLYRQHIFLLWQLASTPLSYRTKFWPLIKKSSFLRMSIAEAEIIRLWKELKMRPPTFSERASIVEGDKALALGKRLGLSTQMHWKCSKVDVDISSKGVSETNRHSLSLGQGSMSLSPAAKRIGQERTQVYERLSMTSHVRSERLVTLFDKFHVADAKKKKVALVECLWSKYNQADDSAALMLELFPELRDSTNIFFMEPSKKGLKRFRSSEHLPEPLGEAMWAHALLDTRVRHNVEEVASLGLDRLPTLMLRLSALDKRNEDSVRRQKAIMRARGSTDWKNCRLQIMKDFFSPPELGWHSTATNGVGPKHSNELEPENSTSVRTTSIPTTESLPGADFWVNDDKPQRAQSYPGQNFWDDDSQ